MKRDAAIDALLDLHGSIIDQGSGYWVKLEAWKVDASLQIPHGIRYSLTLHEPHGKRILGYDNAHETKLPAAFCLMITSIVMFRTRACITSSRMHRR